MKICLLVFAGSSFIQIQEGRMFAQNKNNKKKRRVHYQLSYQVNIPQEVRNQKYKNIKQFVQHQTWSVLSVHAIMSQITLSDHMHGIGVVVVVV